jgi:hypothetical protein
LLLPDVVEVSPVAVVTNHQHNRMGVNGTTELEEKPIVFVRFGARVAIEGSGLGS